MRTLNSRKLPPGVALAAAFAAWGAFAFLFAALPAGHGAAAGLFHLVAGIFAGLALGDAVRRTGASQQVAGRLFWALLGAGLALRFAGDVAWVFYQASGRVSTGPALQDLLYAVSYVLLAAALLWLVARTLARGIPPVVALDTLAVMLSVGTLVWLFFLGPAGEAIGGAREAVVALSLPVCDAALLYLGLVTLSSPRRPPFVKLLVPGLLSFFVADVLYLVERQEGPYAPGGWPEPFWTLGFVFFGLAALQAAMPASGASRTAETPREVTEGGESVRPWRVFAFWLGPLSPPLHFAAILAWSAFAGVALPAYALVAGAVLLAYLALRVSLVSLVTRRLTRRSEDLARRLESARLLRELHGTVKQGVHGVSLALKNAVEAERRGDEAAARASLNAALETARRTEYEVSRPYDELEALPIGGAAKGARSMGDFWRHRLEKFEEYFGVRTHEDLQAPLEELDEDEIDVVYRVVVEAFWNVAKHSGARNLRLESRRVGSVFIVRVRDDGNGFDAKNPPPGLGLGYMRRRAAEAGAKLDVISAADGSVGSTVQLRFERK